MPYDLNQFVLDCCSALKSDEGSATRARIRVLLERLLQNEEFVTEHCSDSAPKGLHILYEDAELGFQILAHINKNARVSPPHDHGESWAIYGQAVSYTDMTEFERVDSAVESERVELKVKNKRRLLPGQAGVYENGAIHSIDYPDNSCFVRVTGTNLDKIKRLMFDLKTGKVTQMMPQSAS